MRKIFIAALICTLCAGCAGQGTRAKLAEENKLIRENEQRLASLESSVTALNSQIAQLNNRVYEVRTRTGQKTSMTVVPIIRPAPAPQPVNLAETAEATRAAAPQAAASQPAAQAPAAPIAPAPAPAAATSPAATPARQPVGRKIDPAAKPGALPAKAAAQPAARQAPKAAAASGSIGRPEPASAQQGAGDLALPPAELHAAEVPVPQGNVSPQLPPMEESAAIPVPVLPPTDLSLPSEQPIQAPDPAPAPVKAPAPKPVSRNAAQGEQAAYNAALSAARSGRTAEGIRLFRDFLQKYPNGPYAANAEYWIGECLYSQGKYQDALSEFQNVNSAYPSHHKNADALLKAGITMNKMGDREGAAEKFRTLITNFPNSDAARRARAMGVR